MQVAPHPHTGLQTVSWLVEGEILHHDSLGHARLVRPGQLNLMTAGRGISHSEQTPPEHSRRLHGVQLWLALPESARFTEPRFEHYADLPRFTLGVSGAARVVGLVGELAGHRSPAMLHSPAVAAQMTLDEPCAVDVPLDPAFEYALLVLDGAVTLPEQPEPPAPLVAGPLLFLGAGASSLAVSTSQPAVVLLIGGTPWTEDLVMWWNFVGRSHDEIVRFRDDWTADRGFGVVRGYPGNRLPAPPMPSVRLRPRPAVPQSPR
jgi:hypothetical protein